jgi:hypothetical protein
VVFGVILALVDLLALPGRATDHHQVALGHFVHGDALCLCGNRCQSIFVRLSGGLPKNQGNLASLPGLRFGLMCGSNYVP